MSLLAILSGPCPSLAFRNDGPVATAADGRARAEANPAMGTVIGKALEDFDDAQGTIEVVVGRF